MDLVSQNKESYTIMDIEQDFENDSENLDEDVDLEIDNKNFTGKLHQFMLSEQPQTDKDLDKRDLTKNTEELQSQYEEMIQGNPTVVVKNKYQNKVPVNTYISDVKSKMRI